MTATALIVLCPGAEEVEFATVPDVLVRAGVQVTVAAAADAPVVRGSRGLPLAAHVLLDHLRPGPWDLIYLPGGGPSAERHRDDVRIQDLAAAQLGAGRLLAAICAAPIALVPRRLCAGRRLTSFPGVRAQVEPHCSAWLDQPVVDDGTLVTSQAAGTTMTLALALAARLRGADTARAVADQMLVPAAIRP